MTHLSTISKSAPVPFPAFTGERIYMASIHHGRLPDHLARWAPTLDAMLVGMKVPEILYLMVDQQELRAGQYHRRLGVHVDGYWNARGQAHERHGAAPYPRHGSAPALPPVPDVEIGPEPSHRPGPKWGSTSEGDQTWATADFVQPEALLLAADVSACRAFVGRCPGGVREGGDCSQVDVSAMDALSLDAGFCYVGTVGTLHESLPVPVATRRTVVRLNIPGAR